jgi:16S rRNA processing protein RimM
LTDKKTLVSIGRLSKTFGHKGQIKLAFDADRKLMTKLKGIVYLKINQKTVPFFLKEIIYANDKTALISIEDVEDNIQAGKLVGYEVFYKTKALKTASAGNDFLDIIGFNLFDQAGNVVGKIEECIDNRGQTLLKVNTGQKEILVPFHEKLLVKIDNDKKIIMVEIAEGLSDINY